jgi:hypothetical protein
MIEEVFPVRAAHAGLTVPLVGVTFHPNTAANFSTTSWSVIVKERRL